MTQNHAYSCLKDDAIQDVLHQGALQLLAQGQRCAAAPFAKLRLPRQSSIAAEPSDTPPDTSRVLAEHAHAEISRLLSTSVFELVAANTETGSTEQSPSPPDKQGSTASRPATTSVVACHSLFAMPPRTTITRCSPSMSVSARWLHRGGSAVATRCQLSCEPSNAPGLDVMAAARRAACAL